MYGILNSITNTGDDSELAAAFAAPLTISSNQPGYAQETLNLKIVTSTTNVQRWEIEAALAPTNNSPDFFVNCVLAGPHETIFVRMPQLAYIPTPGYSRSTPVGSSAGSRKDLRSTSNAAINSNTVNIGYWSGSGTIALSAHEVAKGEFIQFSGDPKVYMVTDGGSHGMGVKILPALRAAVTVDQQVLYGDRVTLHAKYAKNNIFGIHYVDGILSDPGTYSLIEDLADY